MNFIYKLLQTSLFDMSSREAIHWMEKCFGHEHKDFHIANKYHQGFVSDFRRFFDCLDYLDYLWFLWQLVPESYAYNVS